MPAPVYKLALTLTPGQKAQLAKAIEPLHAQYDPAERMLRKPFSSPGYHTTLKGGTVHPTRPALDYAIALLDTGEERWLGRACDILTRVISLQDQNPASKTYGIWSWFLEEPLEKMSPPDWNWADFCGTALLQAALYHRDRLPEKLRADLDAAIQHAARSVQRRNVGPDYTNIAIMGTYVTLVTAELYAIEDLRQYALARWRRFHAQTMQTRAFSEYNSPTYTIVALKEIGRIRLHARDAEALRLTEDVYRVAWQEIADHFHPPTRQWAGPHSRAYRTLLGNEPLAIIQRGTAGRVNFGVDNASLDEHRLPLPCPAELEPFFTSLKEPRTLVKTFSRGTPPVVGTTYLHPAFALGSVNRGDLWNQRRSLLAYWGTPQKPSYLHLRFLHDGYDFSAAQFFSVQDQGAVLAGINFAVNGGDTHVSLDRLKNGTFKARDLRLRFEFGGAAAETQFKAPRSLPEPARLRFGDVRIDLAVPVASFDQAIGQWEAGTGKGTSHLDVVLYSGPERQFNLNDIAAVVLGLAVRFADNDQPAPIVAANVADGRLTLGWDRLGLSLAVRPAQTSQLQKSFEVRRVE